MPDNIERYGQMAAFASLRTPAWHGLGTVFDKPVQTAELLDLAHLSGWNVRLRDLETGARATGPASYEVVRDNPFDGGLDRLGIVGSRYGIVQNEAVAEFGDLLLNGRRRWETAGSINGGRVVFLTLVALDDLVLDPNGQADTIRKYLMLQTSHDGSTNIIAKKVDTRVVCSNTLDVALREAGNVFKIRHMAGVDVSKAERLAEAQRLLGFDGAYDKAFEADAKRMIETQQTKDAFWSLVQDVFPRPEPENKGASTRWENSTDKIMSIWNDSTGSVSNLDNTVWKGFQVLTEYRQWFRGIRNDDVEAALVAGAGFDDLATKERTMIYRKSMALVS